MTDKRILIGEISTVHGIKGLVKVRSFVDDVTLFHTDALFTDEKSDKKIAIKLKNAMKDHWLAEVNGITDRNAAELLRGTQLYIDRDAMPETDDGEFYYEDLKGIKIVDKDGKAIGEVLSVENFGASDLLDIRPALGGQSFYLPFTDDTVLEIDIEGGVITVEIPEGLF